MSLIDHIAPFVHSRVIDDHEIKHVNRMTDLISQFVSVKFGYGPICTSSMPINKRSAMELAAKYSPNRVPPGVWQNYSPLIKDDNFPESYVLYHLVMLDFDLGIVKDDPNGFMVSETLLSDLHGMAEAGRFIFHNFVQLRTEREEGEGEGGGGVLMLSIGIIIGGHNAFNAILEKQKQALASVGKKMDQDSVSDGLDDPTDALNDDTTRSKRKKRKGDARSEGGVLDVLDKLWGMFGWKQSEQAMVNQAAHIAVNVLKAGHADPKFAGNPSVSLNDTTGVSDAAVAQAKRALGFDTSTTTTTSSIYNGAAASAAAINGGGYDGSTMEAEASVGIYRTSDPTTTHTYQSHYYDTYDTKDDGHDNEEDDDAMMD